MVFTNVVNPRSHVSRKDEYRQTLVRRGATLGANCTIVCGVTIGRYAFVGAGAVVTQRRARLRAGRRQPGTHRRAGCASAASSSRAAQGRRRATCLRGVRHQATIGRHGADSGLDAE